MNWSKIIGSDFICTDVMKRWKHRLLADDKKMLNAGSGNAIIHPKAINMDIFDFPNVNKIGSVEDIPFTGNTFDTVWCEAVLEHTPNPIIAVNEMYRVLRTGGLIFVMVPFNHKFHSHPDDYQRWSKEGLKHLMRYFKCEEIGVYRGPSSALLSFITEYMTLFTFTDNKTINKIVQGLTMLCFFPIRFLDLLLRHNKRSHEIANGLYFIGRKK